MRQPHTRSAHPDGIGVLLHSSAPRPPSRRAGSRVVHCLIWIAAAAFVAIPPVPAGCDPLPFFGLRAVAPDGKTYVTINADGAFALARVSRKAPEPIGVADWPEYPAARLRVQAGDPILASGTCALPSTVECLNAGRGFVLWGEWRGFDRTGALADPDGRLVERIDSRGRSLFRVSPRKLGIEPLKDGQPASAWQARWIARDLNRFVVIDSAGQVHAMDLDSGKSDVDPDKLLGDRASQKRPFHLLSLYGAIGFDRPAVGKLATRIAADPAHDPSLKAVSLLALARGGSVSAVDGLRALLARGTVPADARAAVLIALAGVNDASVLQLALRQVRDDHEPVWRAATVLLARLSESGLAPLAVTIRDASLPIAARGRAVWAVAEMAAPDAALVAFLDKMAQDPKHPLTEAAETTLLNARGLHVAKVMIEWMASGRGGVDTATYFVTHPTKDAIPGLIDHLRAHGRTNPLLRRNLLVALKACSGKDLGSNPEPWLAWWDAGGK